jgi:hypothetical protein
MKHLFKTVSAVDVLDDGFLLRVHFTDGKVNDINFEPVLYGELYGPLRHRELFEQVSVDREVGTLVWPNGADFDPDMLYQWNEYVDAFSNQMKISDQSVKNKPVTH